MSIHANSDSPPALRLNPQCARAAGQPIAVLMRKALANPNLISLAAGFVDEATLPIEATQQLVGEVLGSESSGRDALQYGTTEGRRGLRKQIFERFVRPDLAPDSPLTVDQLVVTAGSNQLLHLIGSAIIEPGDIVLTAAPTYFVFAGTLSQLGAKAVGVTADEEGVDPDQLERQLVELEASGQLERLKAIYLVSYFDNPAGSTLSWERRERIVELAKAYSKHHRILVLSDEAYRPLRFDGEDVRSMVGADPTGEFVVAAGTFSKSFSPGIRVGWGILPADLYSAVVDLRSNIDFGSPNLNQCLLERALESSIYDEHLAALCQAYREKRDAMLAAAEQSLSDIAGVQWRRPAGGLYVWLTLPDGVSSSTDSPLFDLAVKRGVLYVPGMYCYPLSGTPVAHNTIRLSYGVETPERIAEGIRILGSCIRDIVGS